MQRPTVSTLAIPPSRIPCLALAVGLAACHGSPQGAADLTPGRCIVQGQTLLSPTPTEYALGVGSRGEVAWVLVADTASTTPLLGIRRAGPGHAVSAVPLPSGVPSPPSYTAVSDIIATPDGPAFAIARGPVLAAVLLNDPPRDTAFPRGITLPARDLVTPTIALATMPQGQYAALASWPAPFGVHRLESRDVHESPGYTPLRRDSFSAPSVVIVGDAALVAQVHHIGRYESAGEVRRTIEVAVTSANPFSAELPHVLAINPPASAGAPDAPLVTAIRPELPGLGAVVVWRDAVGLMATRLLDSHPGGWQTHELMRPVADPNMTNTVAVGSAHGACPTVLAWRSESVGAVPKLMVRATDVAAGRVGTAAEVTVGASNGATRVAVVGAGEKTFVASSDAAGVRVWEVEQSPACAVTLRAVAGASFGAGTQFGGFAGDATHAVLVTSEIADATAVRIVRLDAVTGAVQPAASVPVNFAVTGVALASDAVVLAGRANGVAWLQRVSEGAHPQAGERLLLRGAHMRESAITASRDLHRVWVADVADNDDSAFGPPRSVVLYSAVEGLEDGPRTELRLGVVPEASYARVTLDATTSMEGHPAWGATWSDGQGDDCNAGAWAAMYTAADDQRVPPTQADDSAPWPWVRALVEPGARHCGDRVATARWDGPKLTAVVTGQQVVARVVVGDVRVGPMHAEPLDPGLHAAPLSVGLAAIPGGWLVAWMEVGGNALRYRVFHGDGTPVGPPDTLIMGVVAAPGELASRSVTLSPESGAREAAVAWSTGGGPRLARVQCRVR